MKALFLAKTAQTLAPKHIKSSNGFISTLPLEPVKMGQACLAVAGFG
jgi:hypothetical protein